MFFGLQAFPADVRTLLLFLEFLTLSFASPKSVANVMASVKFHHERLGFDLQRFEHIRLRLALRSLGRTMRTPPSQAAPFPPQLLAPLVSFADRLGPWALAFRALVVLAFFTFARLSSLVPPAAGAFDISRWPTVGDVARVGEGALLRLKYSKTRQGADGGFQVPLRVACRLPCPVAVVTSLLDRAARLRLPFSAPLFAREGGGGGGAQALVSLTQPQARALLARGLGLLGLPPTAFSFHSFRRGGCSFAFAQGAVESDLAQHGDWRSAAIREYYPPLLARARVADALARAGATPS